MKGCIMPEEEERVCLIDADTDERAAYYYGAGWRALDTLPEAGIIDCISVTGLLRVIDASKPREAIRSSDDKGPLRVALGLAHKAGKIWAVAWRPRS